MNRVLGGVGAAIVLSLALVGCSSSEAAPEESVEEVEVAPEESSSAFTSPSFGTVAVSAQCDAAMAAAGAVPLSEVNDDEFAAAASACASADEWSSALYAHPSALGVYDVTDLDVYWALNTICATVPTSATCVDAQSRGYLE